MHLPPCHHLAGKALQIAMMRQSAEAESSMQRKHNSMPAMSANASARRSESPLAPHDVSVLCCPAIFVRVMPCLKQHASAVPELYVLIQGTVCSWQHTYFTLQVVLTLIRACAVH
jgi:hypothetical protein